MGKHNRNNLQDCFLSSPLHLSRERISSQQDFGIKWQHKDLKSNGTARLAAHFSRQRAGLRAGQLQVLVA